MDGCRGSDALLRRSIHFSATSTSLQGVTRNFRGFTEAAIENGLSRAYAGIHFLRAISDGYQQGRGIGRKIENMLPPAGN